MFRLLFDGKGEAATRGRGCLYNLDDFEAERSPKNWHRVFDKLGNGCEVDFPVQLQSHMKWSPQCYYKTQQNSINIKPRDFEEVLSVYLTKERC